MCVPPARLLAGRPSCRALTCELPPPPPPDDQKLYEDESVNRMQEALTRASPSPFAGPARPEMAADPPLPSRSLRLDLQQPVVRPHEHHPVPQQGAPSFVLGALGEAGLMLTRTPLHARQIDLFSEKLPVSPLGDYFED